MREWRRCPQCGFTRCGACPFCFPAAAKRELQQEIAESVAAEEDRARRAAGMLYCDTHDRHDECWSFRRPEPERRVSWQEAMSELRRRYVSP